MISASYCLINNSAKYRKELIHMTQKQYLDKLRNNLRFRLSDAEIDDILSDMMECFEAGISEGKTEEEICIDLGTPKDAAASLIKEQKNSSAGFAARLAGYWLPIVISIVILGGSYYLRISEMTSSYRKTEDLVLYTIPLLIWLLLERKDFFVSICECRYKPDLFTFAGSVLVFAAGIIYSGLPLTLINDEISLISSISIALTLLVPTAMLMLVLSLWKNAPKPFSLAAVAVTLFMVYRAVQACRFFTMIYGNDTPEYYMANVGTYNYYHIQLILACSSLLMIWSLIHRNVLTLPIAYLSVTVVGLMLYFRGILMTLDPAMKDLETFVRRHVRINSLNYILGGIISSAVMMILVIAIKIIDRKRKVNS